MNIQYGGGIVSLLDCYHGTHSEDANAIIRDKAFVIKPRDNHWLGNGVYFFVDDQGAASWWAKDIAIKAGTNPVVLYVRIEIDRSDWLNLNANDDLALLDTYAKELISHLQKVGVHIKMPSEHHWHHLLITSFLEDHPQYKAVRRTFKATRKQVGKSDMPLLSDQLCVVDQSIINFEAIRMIVI